MAIKFLYFDLGNVLVTFCNDRMVRQMAQVVGVGESDMRRVLAEENSPRTSLQWQLEAGTVTPDDYYQAICNAFDCTIPRAELELACSDIFAPIEPSMTLVTRLAEAGHRLGILSNTNALHWDFLTDGRYPAVNQAFEHHVTSFTAQSLKPNAGIYHYAAQRAGVGFDEMFFVDDRPENIEGATQLGIDAVLFTSTEQLERDLRDRNTQC